MNNFIIDFLSLSAIISGIFVITSKNPVISVLFLISVFVNVAGYLVIIGVGFVGISYIIVYVGAVAILFLFVVIILNLQLTELSSVGTEYTQNLPLGAILGSIFVFEIVSIQQNTLLGNTLLVNTSRTFYDIGFELVLGQINNINSIAMRSKIFWPNIINSNDYYNAYECADIYKTFNPVIADIYFVSFQQIQSIGTIIYTNGIIWLIVASIILLLSITGPIALSISRK